MGRSPCCDKTNVKRGPWSPEEDAKLKGYIEQYGTGGNWIALPQKIGLRRCGKSCRLRWLNYLRPNIKHGGFAEEEDKIICSLYMSIGSRWSIMAAQLPGRTDNDIKNYWNTKLKKRLLGKQRKDDQRARPASSLKQQMNKKRENFMNTESIHVNLHHHQLQQCQQSLALPEIIPQQEGKLSVYSQQTNGNSFNNHNNLGSCDISFHEVITNSNDIPYYSSSSPFDELNGMQLYNELDNDVAFSGMDMVNRSTITSSITSLESTSISSWGDINSLVYSPMGYNYKICQQTIQQDSMTPEESSYFRMQQETVVLQ
ncbi:hypothetical protein ACH5RR_013936 [Cinchona calisaya]|uniref:Uncharacterized protein n=1 Tax=Cinchona calisaya TaxID=153742 RepID=A0ABD3A1K4_9GENT